MPITIEVKRIRQSVTQGEAAVYINGEHIITFGDAIELIGEDEHYYGPKAGNWASKKPDSDFIFGLLYHPYDDIYHYSDKFKNAIVDKATKSEQ